MTDKAERGILLTRCGCRRFVDLPHGRLDQEIKVPLPGQTTVIGMGSPDVLADVKVRVFEYARKIRRGGAIYHLYQERENDDG